MLNCEDIANGGEQTPITAEPCVLEELKDQNFKPAVLENSMPSIIRVKRKLKDDPAEALLISCKRKKLEAQSHAAQSASSSRINENVFHFATTVKMTDSLDKEDRAKVKESIATRMRYTDKNFVLKRHHQENNSKNEHCFASLKNKLKSVAGQMRTTCNEKDINAHQQSSSSDEKPVKRRNFTSDDTPAKQSKSENAVSSVPKNKDKTVDDILCNSVKMIREKLNVSEPKDEYVVDVYYCSKEFDWKQHDILNIQPCKYEEFVWDLSDDEEQQYKDDDEDDSNDECNWRNDYPDDEDSIDDDERRCIYDEEECNNSDDCDVRERNFYQGGYSDFEHILDDYNPHANYDDFPVLYESGSDDDY